MISLFIYWPKPAHTLAVGDFFRDGEGAWDQVVNVRPVDPIISWWLDILGTDWVYVTTLGGYTWFIAADEEVVTWLK